MQNVKKTYRKKYRALPKYILWQHIVSIANDNNDLHIVINDNVKGVIWLVDLLIAGGIIFIILMFCSSTLPSQIIPQCPAAAMILTWAPVARFQSCCHNVAVINVSPVMARQISVANKVPHRRKTTGSPIKWSWYLWCLTRAMCIIVIFRYKMVLLYCLNCKVRMTFF